MGAWWNTGLAELNARVLLYYINSTPCFSILLPISSRCSCWPDCLAVEAEGCDISITTCADGGDSSTLVGGDDAATTSDREVTPVDSTTTDATDGEDSSESLPFLGGDDEGEEEGADGVEVDVDGEDQADADAADADTDAANPSAVGGGATVMFVAAAVSLVFMTA